MATLRARFEIMRRYSGGRIVGWTVWRVPEMPVTLPRNPTNSTPVAVADFYGQDAQGRATQHAKTLNGAK